MTNTCPKCNTNNPDTVKFCGECGTQLPSIDDIEVTETLETPKEELTTGSTFAGRYQIIEELGKGGMGHVYKVLDKETKERIALKLIKPEIASDRNTIERFKNELTTARKIRHKNVCGMYYLGEEKGSPYITMEYVSGEDLKSSMRRFGNLPIGKAISITKQICEGLEEAHSLGVVHRDLKPNNIMIDQNGNARIMDFGIARTVKGKGITGSGVMIGTPQYMSPEQVEGKDVDLRSDIYSLGIILYEMLTDRVPFEGETPLTIGVKQKTESPRDPKDFNERISEDLNWLVLKCLEKDRENRFQSAEELKSELEKLEKGLPKTERTELRKKPLTSREITVQLNVRKILFPALIIVVLVAAGLFFLLKTGSKDFSNQVVVAEFVNQTGDPNFDQLGRQAAQEISQGLESLGLFGVAPLTRFDLGPNQSLEEQDYRQIAEDSDAAIIVAGELYLRGNELEIRSKLYDAAKQKLLPSPDPISGEDISGIIEELSDRLKSAVLGTHDPKVEMWQRVSPYIPEYEALLEFIRGIASFVFFDFAPAKEQFLRAVDIDPDYFLALSFVTWSHLWGNREKADEYIEKLNQFTAISPGERLLLDFLKAMNRGDWEGIYMNWKQLEALAPGTTLSMYLAWAAVVTNRPKVAVEALERLNTNKVYEYCNYCYYDFLTVARHMLGNYKQELKDAMEAQRQNPQMWEPLFYKIRALAALGDRDEVYKVIEECYAKPISEEWYPANLVAAGAGMEFEIHGYPDLAAEMYEKAVSWLRTREQKEGLSDHMKHNFAWVLMFTQNWDEAESYVRELIDSDQERISLIGLLGLIAARRGDREEALRIIERMENWDKPHYGSSPFWQAVISANLGQKDRAVSLLLEAYRQGYGLGYTSYYTIGVWTSLGDYPAFIEMMKPRD